ncbi:PIG-L family deacetylase [bacterium]|nr:PIG-L family deacetylase [bacterium]
MPRRKAQKILAMGSHPDDIEIGCGGTLLNFVRQGDEVYLYIATKGEMGGNPETRVREAERSAEILGAKKIFWGGFTDCEVPNGLELIQSMEAAIKEVKPSHVFVHSSQDTHQDHRALAVAAQSSARRVPFFLFYESPTTLNFQPTVYSNIEDTMQDKVELLECHLSQVSRTNIEGLSITSIANAAAIRRGVEVYRRYAEAFMPTRFFLM